MKKLIYSVLLIVTAALTGCEYGKDDVFNQLPDIEIGHVTELDVVPSQIFLGDTLRIAPQITYGKEGNEAFDFKWYKQSYYSLRLISEAPQLAFKMDSLGAWTIRLEVINKKTQVKATATVATTVISRSQRAWYVLKENAQGNTDLDVWGISTSGQNYFTENDILSGWDSPLKGKPISVSFVYNYGWRAPGATYTSTYIPTLFVFGANEGLAIRLADEKIMTRGGDIFFDQSYNTGNEFSGVISSPLQTVVINKGLGHVHQLGTQAFLPPISGDYNLSPYMTTTAGLSKYQLAFDQKSASFVYFKSLPGSLSFFPDKYNPKVDAISSNNMKGNIRFLENTDGSVNPDTTINVKRAYTIFQENGRTDRCILFGIDLAQIDPSMTTVGNLKYSPIMYADTISYTRVPTLKDAQLFALHKNYPILYYTAGNQVYAYNITQKQASTVITFGTGEEVSYIHYVPGTYDTYTFSYLVVATYAAATGTYKIYRYTISGNQVTPVSEIYQGKGKVKSMIFASPNTYSYYGTGSWNDEQYRYY